MGDSLQFIDIIFFAMLAAFLVLRLRSVLGRRTGHERPPPRERFGQPEQRDNVLTLPPREQRATDEQPAADEAAEAGGLARIKLADPSFDETTFVQGAQAAFEMIVAAYAKGDTDTLRPLLSDSVYGHFAAAIQDRDDAGQNLETTLVGIRSAEIEEATLDGSVARVTVKFVSEQVNVTRDRDGEIVEGDPKSIETVTDLWSFERDTRSRDPNWVLVATRTP